MDNSDSKVSKKSRNEDGSTQRAALRKVAEARLERLEARMQKLGQHLKNKPGDLQAMHFLLHQIAVEFHDVERNLKHDPTWYPKPKGKRDKRAIPDPTPFPSRERGEAGLAKKYTIPRPVLLREDRIPEDQRSMGRGSGGRSWCSPPFVEVALPPGNEDKVIKRLDKYRIEEVQEIVRRWAEEKFGSIEMAKSSLKVGATLSNNAAVWRGLIALSPNSTSFDGLLDETLLQNPSARRVACKWHQIEWVKQTAKSIVESAPVGVSKDALSMKIRAHLKSFHTAVNSYKSKKNAETGEMELVTKHTNPQFSYLTQEKPIVEAESVAAEVIAWLDLPIPDRYTKDEEDPKKRGRVTVLQKELGAAKRAAHWRGSEKSKPWAGRPHWKGTISRKREASLVFDLKTDQLALVLPLGGHTPLDLDRYVYIDGASPRSDGQLVSDERGKAAVVMPLIPKHDFLRWYCKHVNNHDPDAPLNKRCVHNTTQFVVIPEHTGHPPRLFVRPVFKFYDPVKEIPDTHTYNATPHCRYLVGIDRGINAPYFAVVYDSETNSIIHARQGTGRKDEWRNLRNEIAAAQRERDEMRNAGAKPKQLEKVMDKIRRLRKRERGLNKVETVEAIAELVEWAEAELGECNYCFVLEELQQMNLKRNNRVKNIAAIKDALINQMRKKGYKYNDRSGRVDGVREESPWHTSAVSPFGWWANPEVLDKDKRFIGRRVGGHYCCDAENGLYLKGCYRKRNGRYGRPIFVLSDDDLRTGVRRRSFGSELFWDPNQTVFQGQQFPNGVIINADFVGAFNIALRPVVKYGQGKGFRAKDMAEKHCELNRTVEITCRIPLYEFVEHNGDPDGAIREVDV